MTKFEQVGVELQRDAVDIEEANKRFAYSCRLCCERGFRSSIRYEGEECRCAISEEHELRVEVLRSIMEMMERKFDPEARANGVFVMIG